MDILTKFDLTDNIKALFLLYLAISSNFLSNTMNCSVHKILIDNMVLKHIFIICLIYFTIDFASKDDLSPLEILKQTMFIYLLYIVLSKQKYEFFLFNFFLIFIIYVITVQKRYDERNKKESNFSTYGKVLRGLQIILVITLTIGFLLYFKKQHTEHKSNFNFIKFMFGTLHCDNIKY